MSIIVNYKPNVKKKIFFCRRQNTFDKYLKNTNKKRINSRNIQKE